MVCDCCQRLWITVRATWTDNGSPFDETVVCYDEERDAWVEREAANAAGLGFEFGINGQLLARGDDTGVPGDAGYGLTLTFTSLAYPVPARLVWDVVLRGEDEEELSRVENSVELFTFDDDEVVPYSVPAPNTGRFMENMRLLIGPLADT